MLSFCSLILLLRLLLLTPDVMSSTFQLDDFVVHPSYQQLLNISKDDWISIAGHYHIPVNVQCTKEVLKNVIVEKLVECEVLPREAEEVMTPIGLNSDQSSGKGCGDSKTAHENLEWERLQLEKLQLQLQHEQKIRQLEVRELEIKANLNLKEQESKFQIRFDPVKATKLLPSFDESDLDGYFQTFERLADKHHWPEEDWLTVLIPKLSGKALKVFNSLDQPDDYFTVKENILNAYQITPDGYRQKFRHRTKSHTETYVEFAHEITRLCNKWLKATKVTTFDQLLNLIVSEQFKKTLPFELLRYIEEKGETEVDKVAKSADAYSLLLLSLKSTRPREGKPTSEFNPGTAVGRPNFVTHSPSYVICSYCKKPGHTIQECRHPSCKVAQDVKSKPQTTTLKPRFQSSKPKPVASSNVNKPHQDSFAPFKSLGCISLAEDDHSYPITILRDTGAAQSILHADVLPNVSTAFTGNKVVLNDLSSHTTYPLARLFLRSPVTTGYVELAVKSDPLPVAGVHLLLGNDLAGELVVPNLKVVDNPLLVNPTEDIDKVQPHLFPSCAVTRSQSRNRSSPPVSATLPSEDLYSKVISKSELIKAQESDPSLAKIRHAAIEGHDFSVLPCYYYHDGVLMRAYRPPELSTLDSWSEVHQIVVPESTRESLIELAHLGFAGHLGITKTYKNLRKHFFWPQMKIAVTKYLQSCHVCQLAGKPNETIPVAPLQPIVVPSEPFDKVVLDCVGPLPKTKRGNEYLITLMDLTTRYPAVFPVKNITAKTVVENLLHFFTTFGVPSEIQTDQGSNFTSHLFRQVMEDLSVYHVTSSAYHPQSQGCLERFHQTLKSMLKKYCLEHNRDWDEDIDKLLFAIRECPQESLGYSPFELVYGREIRGPLKVVKDQWFKTSVPNITVAKYLDNLRTKMSEVRELAKKNLCRSQEIMKKYQVKTSKRSFNPGDSVLVFIPIPGSPLKSKFSGPYTVLKKVSPVNYIIQTPDRRKDTQLVHINLLKRYVSRNSEVDQPNHPMLPISLQDETVTKFSEDDVVDVDEPRPNPLNSTILHNLDEYFSGLDSFQKDSMIQLLHQFPTLTSDVPGFCNLVKHDIKLISDKLTPIKQAPYRIHPSKRDIMKKEIDFLLEHNLAEPSLSPWASPCILVPKPDGTSRLCTDYRKVNSVTVPDSYPLPHIDDLIDNIGKSSYITTLDLMKGYWQVGLTDRAQEISAFVTPFGLYQYTVLSFGLMNAPATFQRLMNGIIQDLPNTAAYLDDVVVWSDTWEEHRESLHHLLGRLQDAGLTINLAKSKFAQATVTYLGHQVGQGIVRPKSANIDTIRCHPTPHNRKSLMRFLGMCGFYRRFCPNFSSLAAPLTNLTSSKIPFKWTHDTEQAFNTLKTLLSSSPVLRAPDFSRPFHLQIDASGMGVGAVLLQEDLDSYILHPVAYHSAKLKPHQVHYSTIEKEGLALVMAVNRFQCYLQGHPHPVQVFSDHNPLVFIHNMKNKNQRMLRWALLLQPYNLQIRHIRGVDNILADTLSRAPT